MKKNKNRIRVFFAHHLKKGVTNIYRLIYVIYRKTVLKQNKTNDYDDLAPVIDIEVVDPNNVYRDALNYAMSNHHIENIAIIGPYGSGKSSIVYSYINHIGLSNRQCLNISLSTFENKNGYCIDDSNSNIEINNICDTDEKTSGVEELKSSKPINELEASILEQILYSNEEGSHKYSRLKRINVPKKTRAILNFVMTSIFVISIACIFSSDIDAIVISLINHITSVFGKNFEGIYEIKVNVWKNLFIIFLLLNNGLVLFSLYRKISAFSSITFTFAKGNLEFKSNNGESLLDKYIDEIFNFFKHNSYKLVIFEDLDRYQNIDIFERLKRINRLLNDVNTNRTNKVKFIYTIGDHMFDDINYKERTKFFDFVLPIIPVLDAKNSISDLKRSFDRFKMKYPISLQMMKDISNFIDDMRTLKNISNEFITYYKLLVDSEDKNFSNKLFAIICYKNRYPLDFDLLNRNSGILFGAIQKCEELQKETLIKIEKNISVIEESVNNFRLEEARALEELDSIYKVFLMILTQNNYLNAFTSNNSNAGSWNRNSILTIKDLQKDLFGKKRYRTVYNSKDYSDMDLRTMNGTSEDYFIRKKRVDSQHFFRQLF